MIPHNSTWSPREQPRMTSAELPALADSRAGDLSQRGLSHLTGA